MASAKDLKNKIRSITNTKKITRTMELVATAKSKRAQVRVNASTPYSKALGDILRSLSRAGSVEHPLLQAGKGAETTLVVVVTANRGLCGGYNTNLLSLAGTTIRQHGDGGKKVEIYVAGKKGVAKFRFLHIPVARSFLNLDDKSTFADAEKVAAELLNRFLAGEVRKVLVVYTHYHSAGRQKPRVAQLLPIEPPADDSDNGDSGDNGDNGNAREAPGAAPGKGKASMDFIFEPDRGTILDSLLPDAVKASFFRMILEAVTSEQIARRMAMKIATDNAEEMIGFYTRFYNRTRQAGITQQINEIVSGANALE